MAGWNPDVSLAAAEVASWNAPGGISTIQERRLQYTNSVYVNKQVVVSKPLIYLFSIMSDPNV